MEYCMQRDTRLKCFMNLIIIILLCLCTHVNHMRFFKILCILQYDTIWVYDIFVSLKIYSIYISNHAKQFKFSQNGLFGNFDADI